MNPSSVAPGGQHLSTQTACGRIPRRWLNRPAFIFVMRPKRFSGVVALACAATLAPMAAVAATASPATRAGAAAAASTPRCATSGLVIWLDTQGSGAAGSIYYRVELTNLSGHTCTLVGYPRVAAVNLGGHQLGVLPT